ncbi:MAG: AhpC/TSA family protein [Prolixibacteraceae bacterium]|nr:AhpC/TSA family protein [Prolixibacteraceae bacterium]
MKKLLIFCIILISFFSCKKSDNFIIEGKITNSPNKKVYLEKLGINSSTTYDSSKVDNQGRFKLKGKIDQPTFFILKAGNQKFITLLIDSIEKINFSADFINFSNDYKIEGSYGSQRVKELNNQLANTNNRIDSVTSLISLYANTPGYEDKISEWQRKINNLILEQQQFSNRFIAENPFSLASVLAIYQKFNNGNYVVQDLQTIKVAASALYSMYPKSEHAKTLYEDTKQLMQDVHNLEVQNFIKEKGVNSPEITLPDSTGRIINLSSLRGKYVLLHFWSANDADSRIMNPVLKENYNKFKTRGFEIYQVCIDTIKTSWIRAIKNDQLNWTNVNDLDGCISAINSYNIKYIPSNYLLDRDGVIIAKDLKGPSIYKKLNEIFN